MYYYMFKASKPLEDVPDKFVNGYIIENDDNDYYNEEDEIEYIKELDVDSEDFKDYLVLNNGLGFFARKKISTKYNIGRDTDEIKNEVGWINEYYFGLDVVPKHYGGAPINPDSSKYDSQSDYDKPWDFVRDDWSAEIKTSSELSIGGVKYPQRLYYVQVSKFKNPPTERFAIWWAEIYSYLDTLEERTRPSSWKYFETTEKIWRGYKIVKGKGLFNPMGYKIAGWDENQGGAQYGPQLYFWDSEHAALLNASFETDLYVSELKTL